jgi:transposase
MRRIRLEPHLGIAELEQRYHRATEPVERDRWQMLWLLARGYQAKQIAAVTGYCAKWVGLVARQYNAVGPVGVPKRRPERVGQRLLSPSLEAALRTALGEAAPDGGLWTAPKVAQWMAQRLGRSVAPQRGWEALRRLGYTPQRPRPHHQQADAAAQAAFPKP